MTNFYIDHGVLFRYIVYNIAIKTLENLLSAPWISISGDRRGVRRHRDSQRWTIRMNDYTIEFVNDLAGGQGSGPRIPRCAVEAARGGRRPRGPQRHPFRAARPDHLRAAPAPAARLHHPASAGAPARAPGHRGGAAGRGDGDRPGRPGAGRLHPRHPGPAGVPAHPAHRPARLRPRAGGDQRVRHQRLPDQGRADPHPADHHHQRRAALLRAALRAIAEHRRGPGADRAAPPPTCWSSTPSPTWPRGC